MAVLYLVATPIGNLKDITIRALEVFESVDFIAAEDTRNTLKLLNHFDIKKPLVSYYEHNIRERGRQIIERLKAGESCALVTDAGMPAISDPGQDIVKLCIEQNVPCTIVPGACAAVSALALSGLETGRFTFEGFLSVNKRSRREHLSGLADERRTMIFYEAPHKLLSTLLDMYAVFGDRRITLAREMTKLYEEIIPTTIGKAVELFSETPPRGEFVLVISGADGDPESGEDQAPDSDRILKAFDRLVKSGLSKNEAVKEVAFKLNVKKNDVYTICISKNGVKQGKNE